MFFKAKFSRFLVVLALIIGYQQRLKSQSAEPESVLNKITFDISAISPEGLVGSPGALRALSYEFCIPARDSFVVEIQAIEPNIEYYPNSRGRIGCTKEQYLCINNTHTFRWKEILFSLARLEYVEKIAQFYGE